METDLPSQKGKLTDGDKLLNSLREAFSWLREGTESLTPLEYP